MGRMPPRAVNTFCSRHQPSQCPQPGSVILTYLVASMSSRSKCSGPRSSVRLGALTKGVQGGLPLWGSRRLPCASHQRSRTVGVAKGLFSSILSRASSLWGKNHISEIVINIYTKNGDKWCWTRPASPLAVTSVLLTEGQRRVKGKELKLQFLREWSGSTHPS